MSTGNTISKSAYARAVSGASAPITISHPPHSHRGRNLLLDRKKKVKKMGWFRKKFNRWVREAWDDARTEAVDHDRVVGHDSINSKSSVRFTVHPASGGFVIEHYKQDRYKDSDGPELTIVNHGDELGKAVEHILTMEALKA